MGIHKGTDQENVNGGETEALFTFVVVEHVGSAVCLCLPEVEVQTSAHSVHVLQ